MLAPEIAKQQLQPWLGNREEQVLGKIAQLPGGIRSIGFALFDLDEDGKTLGEDGKHVGEEDWQEWDRRRNSARQKLETMTHPERGRLFSVFFGPCAKHVEITWHFLKAMPYQQGYGRKAFRAPRHPQTSFAGRLQWLRDMILLACGLQGEALTAPWLAAWAPYLRDQLWRAEDVVGRMLAAVIDAGGPVGEEVFSILCQSTRNEHAIGGMGRHVSRALLSASRPEGWELMEKMLLAAQRQEGLRQTILETIDEAHPEAFRRMLGLIRDHQLARFSSVVRALNVWFGLQWDSAAIKPVQRALDRAMDFLEHSEARDDALESNDPEAAFLALWAGATEDAFASMPPAEKLLGHKKPEFRLAAVVHLSNLGLPQAGKALFPALEDADVRIAWCALSGAGYAAGAEDQADSGLFERLQRLFERLPAKPVACKPLLWEWAAYKIRRDQVAQHLVSALGNRSPTVLIPYMRQLNIWTRRSAVEMLSAQKKWDALTRATLLDLAGDPSADVRAVALKGLDQVVCSSEEIRRLEDYLARKTSDLRQGVVALLAKQTDPHALASAERLLASKDGQQRLGGLELLRQMTAARRIESVCRARAEEHRTNRGSKLTREESTQIAAILQTAQPQWSLDDALGLMIPAQRTRVTPPRSRKVDFVTPAAVGCLKALDDCVHEHRETAIQFPSGQGGREVLLGNIRWEFPYPNWQKTREENLDKLPLRAVWMKWAADRTLRQRDRDGLELFRAGFFLDLTDQWSWKDVQEWCKQSRDRQPILKALSGGQQPIQLRYPWLVKQIVAWLLYLEPPAKAEFCLQALETLLALVPPADNERLAAVSATATGSGSQVEDWRGRLHCSLAFFDDRICLTTPDQQCRLWQLLHWLDQPTPEAKRHRPGFDVVAKAYLLGQAGKDDLLDDLLGPRESLDHGGGVEFFSLRSFTARKLAPAEAKLLAEHSEIGELVEACRQRVLDIELKRGEAATAATVPAWHLQSVWGSEVLFELLAALGPQGFKLARRWSPRGRDGKNVTHTQLVSVTYPRAADSPQSFVNAARQAIAAGLFPEHRLLELAFLAPQWASFVEHYFGWPGLREGLYWFLAHMRYVWEATDRAAVGTGVADETIQADSHDDRPQPSPWQRLIAERTPLTEADRQAGAMDVPWFGRTYEQLGPKRWQALGEAARFAANPAQANRAQFIADVLTGTARRKDLFHGVRTKKLKDFVRLLGLYPLAKGDKRETDLVERYHVLQEYHRYARGLSAMTKPQALLALEIGMRNLASTAGYTDPLRLEWALEAAQVKELIHGPIAVRMDDVTVTLALDDLAQPCITVQRAGKELKAIPPAVKKDKRVAALLERAAQIKQQTPRMKHSLEGAMCRGDVFTGAELMQLCQHAVLAPLLKRLVLVGDRDQWGYPDKAGKVLRDCRGATVAVKKTDTLRIAHSHDLWNGGQWHAWQQECFESQRIQPFKQVFRELYVVTKQEKQDGIVSRRYAGQQVNSQQAYALWGQRGWHTQEGVWKSFHDLGLTVSVNFRSGQGTPLEVEGLTMDGVQFTRRDECKPLKLTQAPEPIFSEVMRDLDLVVSVAHRGGVDPEASASTMEMRAALLRETIALLNLRNVRCKNQHVLIDGKLAQYSVHLGGGTVHRLPGGAVCIVPVHAQHRGRLFLPFADDDPITAEVLAKVILLARDEEIQDPTILEQLRG